MSQDKAICELIRAKRYEKAATEIASESSFQRWFSRMSGQEQKAIIQAVAKQIKVSHKSLIESIYTGHLTKERSEELARKTYQNTLENLYRDGGDEL